MFRWSLSPHMHRATYSPSASRRWFRPWLEELESRMAPASFEFPGPQGAFYFTPTPAVTAYSPMGMTYSNGISVPGGGFNQGVSTDNFSEATGFLSVNSYNGAPSITLGLPDSPSNYLASGYSYTVVQSLLATFDRPASSQFYAPLTVPVTTPPITQLEVGDFPVSPIQSPQALPLNTPAPLQVWDPVNFLLRKELNAAGAANMPTLLTQAALSRIEGGGGGAYAVGGGGNPANQQQGQPPVNDTEQFEQDLRDVMRFLSYNDSNTDNANDNANDNASVSDTNAKTPTATMVSSTPVAKLLDEPITLPDVGYKTPARDLW